MPCAWAIPSTQGAHTWQIQPKQTSWMRQPSPARSSKRAQCVLRRSPSEPDDPPCLAAVLVGTDPASVTYVKMKRVRCERVGVRSVVVELPDSATTREVVGAIGGLSQDVEIDGILLQQ